MTCGTVFKKTAVWLSLPVVSASRVFQLPRSLRRADLLQKKKKKSVTLSLLSFRHFSCRRIIVSSMALFLWSALLTVSHHFSAERGGGERERERSCSFTYLVTTAKLQMPLTICKITSTFRYRAYRMPL